MCRPSLHFTGKVDHFLCNLCQFDVGFILKKKKNSCKHHKTAAVIMIRVPILQSLLSNSTIMAFIAGIMIIMEW